MWCTFFIEIYPTENERPMVQKYTLVAQIFIKSESVDTFNHKYVGKACSDAVHLPNCTATTVLQHEMQPAEGKRRICDKSDSVILAQNIHQTYCTSGENRQVH